MSTLIHADIFFFVATIGFVLLGLVLLVAVIYLIVLLRNLSRIAAKIEERFDTAAEEMRELLDRLYDSTLFRWFFSRKRKPHTRE